LYPDLSEINMGIKDLRLLSISSLYPGYLESFYTANPGVMNLSYTEHLHLILENSTDFTASYIKTFSKHGLIAECIIGNDKKLQRKWCQESGRGGRNDKELMFEQVKSFNPEILWIEDLSFISSEWLENLRLNVKGIRLVIACFCAPYNTTILEKLKSVDFVFVCTPGIKNEFEYQGIRSYLVYHGFDTDLSKKISSTNDTAGNDIIFSGSLITGTGYHGDRIELINSILDSGLKPGLYLNLEKNYRLLAKRMIHRFYKFIKCLGFEKSVTKITFLRKGISPVMRYPETLLKQNRGPVFGQDMYRLLQSSKIVLNNHGEVAGSYAGNMRIFEATGLGSCLLTDDKSNLTDLFDTEKEIVVYKNSHDCINKINWLLNHEEERKEIAKAGQRKTLALHTVDARCKQMEAIIYNEISKL
jgi:spore maturation protein CgeB